MVCLVVTEIFLADQPGWNKPVGSSPVQLHKQARTGHPRDAALERRADAVSEKVRDQPVRRLALGRHGTALASRDPRGDLAKAFCIGCWRQAVGPQLART